VGDGVVEQAVCCCKQAVYKIKGMVLNDNKKLPFFRFNDMEGTSGKKAGY
jgi:hypothetical protein